MDVHITSQCNNRSDRCSKSCRSTNVINNTNLLSPSTKDSISNFLKLFIVTRFGAWRRWLVQQKCHDLIRKVQGIINLNDWVGYLKLTNSLLVVVGEAKLPAVWRFVWFSTKKGPRNVSGKTWFNEYYIRIRLSHAMDMVREPNRWGTSFWRLHLRVRYSCADQKSRIDGYLYLDNDETAWWWCKAKIRFVLEPLVNERALWVINAIHGL